MSWSFDEQTHKSTGSEQYDISSEKLDSMSPAELVAALEHALDTMTEETYDSAVIDAYLAKLDCKSPMPNAPDSKESFSEFQHKLLPFSALSSEQRIVQPTKSPSKVMRLLHSALVAALITIGLLGGIIAVQASGIDVFGAMAHWTENVLSFGPLPNENRDSSQASTLSGSQEESHADLHWMDELQTTIETHDIQPKILKAPSNFSEKSYSIFVDPITENVGFSILYTNEAEHISFDFSEYSDIPSSLYEKDNNGVEQYMYNGVVHYIYTNNENIVVAWAMDNVEYCISTNSTTIEIRNLIKSMYEV